MNYGKILKDAWKRIWTHKVIIGFGYIMMIPSLILGIIFGGFFFFFNEKFFPTLFSPYAPTPDINPLFSLLFFVFIFGFIFISYAATSLSFSGVFKGTLILSL